MIDRYVDSEPVWNLRGFVDVPVERVGDEDDRNLDFVVAVDELLERFDGRVQHLRTSRQYSVDIETDSELRLCATETTASCINGIVKIS